MSEISVNLFSIWEILEKYPDIFLDTNVFFGINLKLDENRKENYIQSFIIKEKLLNFWIPILKENPGIYLTENIFGELKRDSITHGQEYSEVREIKKRIKHKKNYFLSGFPLERIIDRSTLEEKALYDELHKKYNPFIKSSENLEGIGENDFDLLIIGGIFSKLREDTCLISNDLGILRCYKSFLKEERMTRGDFGFYIQRGLNLFKRA
jgi:hypothetical protein